MLMRGYSGLTPGHWNRYRDANLVTASTLTDELTTVHKWPFVIIIIIIIIQGRTLIKILGEYFL